MTAVDLVVSGATFRTMDAARPVADEVALRDGLIVAVGHAGELSAEGGVGEVIDLGGATVVPGFVDAHVHHAAGGRALVAELALPRGATLDDILHAVATHTVRTPPGEWVIGGTFPSALLPLFDNAHALDRLDAASAGHPVILSDDTYHNRFVNSAALDAAGLRDAGDPPGGTIVRERSGRATGLLIESAGAPADQAARSRHLTRAEHAEASRAGIDALRAHGVTAFQDAAATLPMMQALADLDGDGQLGSWVVTSMMINDPLFGSVPTGRQLLEHGERFRTAHHRPDFVKIFLDGVPPARTAAFVEPYLPHESHAPGNGELTVTPKELREHLDLANDFGLSVKIHCAGDRAVSVALDAIEHRRERGSTSIFQIAHAAFVQPDDIRRMAALDVVADLSPFLWMPGDLSAALTATLGADRAERIFPVRSFLDAGVRPAGGSDWPVGESHDPLLGIAALVTRADPTRRHPGALGSAQSITLDEAFTVFTSASAAAIGLGQHIGSIEVGKSADFAVLDRDPWMLADDELGSVGIAETWFAGVRHGHEPAG